MNVEIRKMIETDIAVISQMEQMYFTDAWSKGGIEAMIKLPYVIALTAVRREQIQGYCFFSFLYEDGELLNIAVRAENRNLKIGSQLIEEGIRLGKGKGVTAILLEVRESNEKAKKFYLAKGFVKMGIRKNFYEKPNENAITMKRLI